MIRPFLVFLIFFGLAFIASPYGVYAKDERANSVYEDQNLKVTLVSGNIEQKGDEYRTKLKILVEPINPTKIIRPQTHVYFRDGDGNKVEKAFPVSFLLNDNFGNSFYISEVTPQYTLVPGERKNGLRHGDKMEFTLYYDEQPLAMTEYLNIRILRDVFKTQKDIILQVPYAQIQGTG